MCPFSFIDDTYDGLPPIHEILSCFLPNPLPECALQSAYERCLAFEAAALLSLLCCGTLCSGPAVEGLQLQ